MQNSNTNTSSSNAAKINDFGQKIGGARKDLFAEAKEWAEMVAGITPDTLAAVGLKSVRRPNLEKMAENGAISKEKAAAAWVYWRRIGRKPAYTSPNWGQRTRAALDNIAALLTNQGEQLPEEMTNAPEFRVIMASGWPAVPFSFGVYEVRKSYNDPAALRIVGGHYWRGETSTDPANIAAQLRAMVEDDNEKTAAKRASGPDLGIYKNRAGVYFIAPTGKAEIILKTFEDFSSARAYMNENRAVLVERYTALRQFPALRRDWNRPRTGEDWRNGENVTPEKFAAVLPFRGVEFGNWVNQAERAALLNSAFDGFHDLAAVFGIDHAAVTLSGSLAFAFGARGHSKAAAHYEPARAVINLTKKNGAGCMAHEWFHAVDNFAAGGGVHNYATERTDNAAAAAILTEIKKSDFFTRSKNLADFLGNYWTEGRELTARAFEGVTMYILKYNGICSDFLANVSSFDEFTAQDIEHRSSCYPYPTEDEAAALLPLYVDFFRSVFGDGVTVNPDAIADSEKARAKAAAEQAEAERIRAERLAAYKEEQRKKAEAEQKAEEERKQANEEKAKAEAEKMAANGPAIKKIVISCDAYESCIAAALGDNKILVFRAVGSSAGSWGVTSYKIERRYKRPRYYDGVKSSKSTAAEALELMEERDDIRTLCRIATADYNPAAVAAAIEEAKRAAEEEAKKPAAAPKAAREKQTIPDTDEAPAEGLALVEIADGVAVVGDSRDTYRNRKAIKAHGATWNKAAQQWQATTPEAVAALRAWFGMNDEPTPEPDQINTDHTADTLPDPPAVVYIDIPAEEKTADTLNKIKCPAPLVTTADTNDPQAMKKAAESVREWCNADQLTEPEPYAADLDNLAALAWSVLTNYTPTEAAQMTAAALQLAAKIQRRANTIFEGSAAMEEANRNETDADQWNAAHEEIKQFNEYADALNMYAEGIAAAVGVPDWQLSGVAAIPEPQPDPAQIAMELDNTPAPVTDAEVYEQAARIRAIYETLKTENETNSQPDETKDFPRCWAGKIDQTKKMQFAHVYDYKDGIKRHNPIMFYGTKKGLLSWVWQQLSGRIINDRLTGDWISMGRGRNEWRMYDEKENTAIIVTTQEMDAKTQLELLRAWNPDSLTDYEKNILRDNDPNEDAARVHFNDLADTDPEGTHNVYYRIDVPYYVDSICTHNAEINEMAEIAVCEFYKEITTILQADGWTNEPHKYNRVPEMVKGNQRLYCHPQNISGSVKAADIERLFNLFLTAKTFTTNGADDYGAARHSNPINTLYPIGASCAVPVAA